MNAISRLFRRFFGMQVEVPTITDQNIVDRYVVTGLEFGDAVSYIYMGECVGFIRLLDEWQQAERDYSLLGYRTCSLDDFIAAGGWGKELENLKVAREIDEAPVFHAAYYRQHYLGKDMMVSVKKHESGAVTGDYIRLSTQHLVRK